MSFVNWLCGCACVGKRKEQKKKQEQPLPPYIVVVEDVGTRSSEDTTTSHSGVQLIAPKPVSFSAKPSARERYRPATPPKARIVDEDLEWVDVSKDSVLGCASSQVSV